MTITLTREEAQQVLVVLEYPAAFKPTTHAQTAALLRARLAQPEPEPVAWMMLENKLVPIHTAPPQRNWQGLTDEEMSEAMDYWSDPVRSAYGGAVSANEEYIDMVATWRYIEAKLKEKNT